jgi:hypothetical protein
MEIFVSRCFGMLFCSFKTMFFLIMQFCFEYVCSAHMQAGRVAFGFSCTLHDLIPTSTLSTNYNIFSDTVANVFTSRSRTLQSLLTSPCNQNNTDQHHRSTPPMTLETTRHYSSENHQIMQTIRHINKAQRMQTLQQFAYQHYLVSERVAQRLESYMTTLHIYNKRYATFHRFAIL